MSRMAKLYQGVRARQMLNVLEEARKPKNTTFDPCKFLLLIMDQLAKFDFICQ